ncbi:hypothetical protein KCV07_g439, partial [Aureobasidium melanogenum]
MTVKATTVPHAPFSQSLTQRRILSLHVVQARLVARGQCGKARRRSGVCGERNRWSMDNPRDPRLDSHVLRSGRQYSPPIEVLALSGQANNNLAMMTGQNNNNNTATTSNQANNDLAMMMGQEDNDNTSNRANSNAINDTAEVAPRTRRVAELEARGFQFICLNLIPMSRSPMFEVIELPEASFLLTAYRNDENVEANTA